MNLRGRKRMMVRAGVILIGIWRNRWSWPCYVVIHRGSHTERLVPCIETRRPLVRNRLFECATNYPSFFLRRSVFGGLEAVLVHDPICFTAIRGPSLVEDEGFSHADYSVLGEHGLVPAGGFPETGRCGSVSPGSGWVLPVFVAEKVPLVLFIIPQLASRCTSKLTIQQIHYIGLPYDIVLILRKHTHTHTHTLSISISCTKTTHLKLNPNT